MSLTWNHLARSLRRPATLVGFAIGLAFAVLIGGRFLQPMPVPMTRGPLPQQAYLWQRQWTENVRAAAEQAGSGQTPLEGLCIAYAEIFPPANNAAAPPAVQRPSGLDWALLARCHRPVGFAVRVREFPGEVSATREPFLTLCHVIGELCLDADAARVKPAEIQVDFDCPTSRLRGFTTWMRALQKAFPGQTFRFTALPAWLRSRDFAALARTTGGYVLQVHSFEKSGPDGRPPATLCDPALARAAVDRAARLGVPFRVALPTYSYRLVLDGKGRLLAAAGEGSALEMARPPPNGTSRVLMADPAALADLIRDWQTRRPQALQGVIWYRLPAAGDRLNWMPRTLWAVMAGRRPRPQLALQFDRAAGNDGLCELRLRNDGEADAPWPGSITVRCASVPSAADGVGGFALEAEGPFVQTLVFTPRHEPGTDPRTLPAGGSLLFGWVRVEGTLTGAWTPASP